MRIGSNPSKDQLHPKSEFYHQIIIPVYIPEHTGYFKDALTILRFCIESLLRTSHSHTYITIVDNGSDDTTKSYLRELYNLGQIHELIHTTQIGKLNAILKGLTGHNFKLITISDSDVLFLSHWQAETYKVFNAFPKAGVVSPVPTSRTFRSYTSNILLEKLFSKSLCFTTVKDPEAMQAFADSISNPGFCNEHHLRQYLTITSDDVSAVVGAGHFIATYRSEVFESVHQRYSAYSLGGNSVRDLLDIPVVDARLWRLSTTGNYAYHMGNTPEKWMETALQDMPASTQNSIVIHNSKHVNGLTHWFSKFIFSRLIGKRNIAQWFLRHKGMSSSVASKYL